MKIYTFPRGGISFEDPTVPPKDAGVIAFLPVLSVIPLIQHPGGKASPVVAVGDQVREGMLIGRGQGPGSANIHATVPGKVVRTVSWDMAEGMSNEALVIRLGGGFEKLGKEEKVFPWEELMPFALQQLIADYGVVEMEGSGRPVAELLASAPSRSTETPATLVVRCVFDDPWLAADYVLCRERLKAVAEGSMIISRSVQISRIVYAVSHQEKELGNLLLAEAGNYGVPASLVLVGSRYPQKNPRELELVLRNYEKHENLNLGSFLILGPATLAAVYDAVKLKKPVLDRYVAVGGSAVKTPQVMRARIGTRLRDLFAECGGFVREPQRIAIGSPLSGRRVADLDEPVIKTSYAVAALLEHQTGGTVRRNCIGCGDCRMVCPVELDPEALFKAITGPQTGTIPEIVAACHGCGCCDLVCPSRLPLSTVIQDAAQGK
ncbi:MAG: SLBB domain-containing protein [Treponema sp.]|jgi:electron transport complex protein RnfC|nr:SLBB domain-containing protein [Treponema sp.]